MSAEMVQVSPAHEKSVTFFRRAPYGAFSRSMSSALIGVGEQLGLFDALTLVGEITAPAFAARTGFDEHSLGEWLNTMVGMGRVEFDAHTGRFSLPGPGFRSPA